MQNAKNLFTSKTFWLATIQAIAGALVIYSTAYPSVGVLVVLKSIVDIYLRSVTSQPVTI